MKLYLTTWDEHPEDETVSWRRIWTGTQADQKRAVKDVKAAGFEPLFNGEIEVPTDKPSLLNFLNTFTLPKGTEP